MKKIVFILFIMLVSSCQYKYNGPWQNNIYPAYWKYELYPSLSKCDDEKMKFIKKFFAHYPDVDSSFFDSKCLDIPEDFKNKIKGSFDNGSINLLNNNFNVVVNFKRKEYLIEGTKIFHHITIECDSSKLKNNMELWASISWQYDKKNGKWILDKFIILHISKDTSYSL